MTPLKDRTTWIIKPHLFNTRTTMLQLKETIQKTKSFFHKSLQNFRPTFSKGYQKLPKPHSFNFNPFLCRTVSTRSSKSDQFYNEGYDFMQSDLNKMNMVSEEPAMEASASNGSFMCFGKQSAQKRTQEDTAEEKENKGSSQLRKKKDLNSQEMNKRVNILVQKMKELDMMDPSDLEHVLDIEEALYYYSRLKSPVYLDIVDKFFMNINSEFSVPQPSISFKGSKERLGSYEVPMQTRSRH